MCGIYIVVVFYGFLRCAFVFSVLGFLRLHMCFLRCSSIDFFPVFLTTPPLSPHMPSLPPSNFCSLHLGVLLGVSVLNSH